jgi:hypothetical protein
MVLKDLRKKEEYDNETIDLILNRFVNGTAVALVSSVP